MAQHAESLGARQLLVPFASADEAAIASVPVIPVRSIKEAVAHLVDEAPIVPVSTPPLEEVPRPNDLAQVPGQEAAKRALEVAAAGGHHLLMIGPPGSAKTSLARRFPGILPPLTLPEAIEVTKIYSLVAEEPPAGLAALRPFRSPHPAISTAGLLGGGPGPRPGEVTLAHAGVLFLDDLPEFRRDVLGDLAHALDHSRVRVIRNRTSFTFPARFSLIAAMSGCPCGHLGDPRQECRCARPLVERFRSRISRSLIEHIDIHVEMAARSKLDLRQPSESSSAVATRVLEARQVQSRRYSQLGPGFLNASVHPDELMRHCELSSDARRLLDHAIDRLQLTTPRRSRILALARSIADLDASDVLRPQHVAEAIQYHAPATAVSRASS